jgi:antitoxin (DNA-binding transcriptional repressor) of toxin-antitoxin stability system
METQRVGIREFRDNLATYLLESEAPVAITRHGDTVGFYIPARRKRTDAEKAAFKEAMSRWQRILDEKGISEDEIAEDFKLWRKSNRERTRG